MSGVSPGMEGFGASAEQGDPLASARAALRIRQGAGARHDAAAAPAEALRWARLGTACFARALNELDDAALWAPASRPGWSRRRVIAMVGLEGRAMAQAIARAIGAGSEDCAEVDEAALNLAETLPARALRHLVAHAAAHLDITWRDLTDGQWDVPVEAPFATARATVPLRARTLWRSALDLRCGVRRADVPADFVAALEHFQDTCDVRVRPEARPTQETEHFQDTCDVRVRPEARPTQETEPFQDTCGARVRTEARPTQETEPFQDTCGARVRPEARNGEG